MHEQMSGVRVRVIRSTAYHNVHDHFYSIQPRNIQRPQEKAYHSSGFIYYSFLLPYYLK